uniref:ADP-ribosylation factor-like protein 6 n=1 Tax=Spodoptera frugiperda TaxID=7108 RepID=A0A2H1WPW3_SPOFR
MGLLLSKIWSLFGNEEHKLLLVGLDNAGKTTILYQLLLGETVHTRPTIGSNVEEFVWKNLRFVMWDLGGQQSLRSAWNTYFTNSEFVIMVVDSTDRQRLSLCRDELHQMLKHEELTKACLLVYANKQDGDSYIIWGALLVTMVLANTWGCRHYLRSLDAATNSAAPTVISAGSSYVLSVSLLLK